MSFEFGQFNEFSDPVTIHDPVVMAVAKAINLGKFTGQFYQSMVAPTVTLTQKAFKVYGRTKTSRDGIIGNAWAAAGAAGLSMPDSALKGLTIGHVLLIGGTEVVIVNKVNRDDNTIEVLARGYAGSVASAHGAGTAYKVIGYAGNDTDLKNVESMTETTNEWENYIQTVYEVMDWTKHGELLRQGLTPAQATMVNIREAEIRIAEMLAVMSIHGRKKKALSNNDRFMSAGLIQQLTDDGGGTREPHIYNANGEITERKVCDALKRVFDGGGNPNTIWCNPTVKEFLNNFNRNNSALNIIATRDDHTAGGIYVTEFNYEGNILKVRIDRDIPNGTLAVVNQGKCKKGWLDKDGLRMVDEPTPSSREFRKSLQGSLGFWIEDVGIEHELITGITSGPPPSNRNVTITNTEENPVATKTVA